MKLRTETLFLYVVASIPIMYPSPSSPPTTTHDEYIQALVPGADALTAGARAAARATSTSFCGDFVKASRLLRHACAPDIAGDPRDESAAG